MVVGVSLTTHASSVIAAFAVLAILDVTACRMATSSIGARWFLLHALGNAFTIVFALPDLYYTFKRPLSAMSGPYCQELHEAGAFAACSDWPQCMIVALHAYHMLAFKLSKEDMFHHLLFVPTIAGANFMFQFGSSGNILAFFISGLPGGIDYALLGFVKVSRTSSAARTRVWCRGAFPRTRVSLRASLHFGLELRSC